MSTLQAKIPDLLLQQVNELAAKENVAVDQIVSAALSAQVSASKAREVDPSDWTGDRVK